ncbi:unnamed protein product [Trifolium pratense]|uniref:Uncharacterized protein n=1 Tax=Trifolium pratense TaxID=57577 RepID=A0ACB0II00_TRIPR|nr:unnamed protein product [Trifolium pratense]
MPSSEDSVNQLQMFEQQQQVQEQLIWEDENRKQNLIGIDGLYEDKVYKIYEAAAILLNNKCYMTRSEVHIHDESASSEEDYTEIKKKKTIVSYILGAMYAKSIDNATLLHLLTCVLHLDPPFMEEHA